VALFTEKQEQSEGAQIDLLFDRDDDVITVCEIKYTSKSFAIDKSYAKKLITRVNVFKEKTKTKKQIFIALISANGIQKTIYSEARACWCTHQLHARIKQRYVFYAQPVTLRVTWQRF
jgi:hypothetical protein